jgi:hypothetical protein
MAEEAGRLSPPLSAPSSGRVGDTLAAPSSSAGSTYELNVLGKAQNIATSELGPDDEHELVTRLPRPDSRQKMSRVPLLVRSSPAQGTGKLMAHFRTLLSPVFATFPSRRVVLYILRDTVEGQKVPIVALFERTLLCNQK